MVDIDAIASGYLEYQGCDRSSKYDGLFKKTVMLMVDLIRDDPEKAYQVICRAIELTDDEWLLTLIGSGILEDFIYKNYHQFINRIKKDARKCKKFAFAVSCVWLDELADDEASVIDDLVDELGIERT